MDVVVVIVSGRLEVLRGQRQHAGVGVDGEARGVVAFEGPGHAAVGGAFPGGGGRGPGAFLRHVGVGEARNRHRPGVVVADLHDGDAVVDDEVGVVDLLDDDPELFGLLGNGVFRGRHAKQRLGCAFGKHEGAARVLGTACGEVPGGLGRTLPGAEADREVLLRGLR